jgi:hypothetical protein
VLFRESNRCRKAIIAERQVSRFESAAVRKPIESPQLGGILIMIATAPKSIWATYFQACQIPTIPLGLNRRAE